MSSSAMDNFPPLQETLLEFRAGKMIMEGKKVIPDTRKGLFRLGKGEEGLVHFQWLDRSNNNIIEDDQIVFPDEAVFEKVNQASGRVYILKFHTDDRKFFFWLQEPEAINDSELCNSVNLYLNHPLAEFLDEEEPDASIPPHNSEEMIAEDIPSSAGNSILPSMGGEASSGLTSSGPVKLADLQRILSNMGSSADAVDPDAGLGLGDILRPDLISPLIKELPVGQQLSSYLPEGKWTTEELIELLQSPPFRQQVDSFTYVLRTGQIDLTQFEIDPSKYKLTVPSFLEALEDSVTGTLSAELRQDDTDLTSQMCNHKDPMDES